MTIHTNPSLLDSMKNSLVALKMPRALEMLDATVRQIEQGEVNAIEALDHLLIEDLTLRDNWRIKAVEAVKAGKSVAFLTLADIIASLVKAER